MNDIYGDMNEPLQTDFGGRGDLKEVYVKFFADFKQYLVEYIKEQAIDLCISNVEATIIPIKLFEGEHGGMRITLKNQGAIECYITTDKRGAYRLDPDEKEEFWLNSEVTIVTLSGVTTVGYIRS